MNAIPKGFSDAVERQLGALNEEVKQALQKASVAEATILNLEQKFVRMEKYGGRGAPETKSWGEQFVESDGLKAFADHITSRPGRFRMDLKTTVTMGSTSGGPLAPDHRATVVGMPQRRLRVRDLLPRVPISTGVVEYPKQTTRTNNAATVAEAASKPESALGWTMENVTAQVIAHWIPASVQVLDDAPQLRGLIDSELRYGLAIREDAQLLSGDGSSPNLDGLITNATAYSAPFDPAGTETMIDIVALALLQATLADYEPTGIVMHSSDWMRIRLLKDSDGKYLLGDPGAQVQPMLFGKPVIPTTSMTIDKFLVGDFPAAATIYDRWEPRVEVSTEHDDFFTRNLVAIRAEERLALAIKQPGALIYGDFGNVA